MLEILKNRITKYRRTYCIQVSTDAEILDIPEGDYIKSIDPARLI